MGYPMTYGRVLSRSGLYGNYTHLRDYGGNLAECGQDPRELQILRMICGDLRRLERDSLDGEYATKLIADRAGVGKDVVLKVLSAFFEDVPARPPHDGD